MGQLRVDPGSLESAAALLRGAYDHTVTMLARAIVDDLQQGVGGAETSDAQDMFATTLPQVTEFVREQTEAISGHLDAAAGAYRRTDWLIRVTFAEQS